ncbi:MAG: cysteine desulfurase [Lachnospiraceae bacterium]|nr:cysteine desulfurase [Lachnospiraceae bacterium]
MSDYIYLDNAATTRCGESVLDAMRPYLEDNYANPSGSYNASMMCRRAVEESRAVIAEIIGAKPEEIIFTSGGTESDNFAIKGTMYAGQGSQNQIITSKIEHHAVINTCKYLEKEGFFVKYLDVDKYGVVDMYQLQKSISKITRMISVMYANNEIGTIEPVEEIGRIAAHYGKVFHVDAVQAFGQIPIDVNKIRADLMSMSSHKIHGPKGIGALYIRKGSMVENLLHGGEQEFGMRAGTENVAGIVGFAAAAKEAADKMNDNFIYVSNLRNHMIRRIINEIPNCRLNGSLVDTGRVENAMKVKRLPGNVNFSFAGIKEGSIPLMLDAVGVCASSGSACTSFKDGPSHVLEAIGLEEKLALASVRFTIGSDNTLDDINKAVDELKGVIRQMRISSGV